MSAPDFALFDTEKLTRAIAEAWNEALRTTQEESCFLVPQATAQDIPYAIRSFIDANLASLAHDLNESNAVKLPAEIIAEVLSHLPLEDRFTASLVSPDWNTALKTSPHLWDEMVSDHTRDSVVWMERFIQLSGDTSLNLDITVSAQNQDILLETLLQVLDRCLSLQVFFNSDYGWPDVDRFINTIAGEAPRLLRFGLHDTVPPHLYHGIGPGVKLFGGLTNNLVRIELECDLVALDNLDAAAFANVITAYVSHHGDMTPASLWRLFHVLPVVEALTIQIEGWNGPEDEDAKPITPPTSLRSLDLMADKDTTSLLPMLASLNWRDIFRVGLCIEGHSYTVNQLVSFFSGTPRVTDGSSGCVSLQTAWIDWYDEAADLDRGVCVFLTDSNVDPHALILQSWQGSHPSVTTMERSITMLKAQPPAAICVNITRLYLHELTFDSVALPAALPEFPAVTHLTIVLANSHFTRNDLGISPFIVHSTDDTLCSGLFDDTEDTGSEVRCYQFPRLSTLWITAGNDMSQRAANRRYRPTLTPAMILEFVDQHFVYNSVRVENLAFFGVELHIEPGNRGAEEFEEMLSLAHDVTWDERSVVWAINYDLMKLYLED